MNISNVNGTNLTAETTNLSSLERCGICEKEGAEVSWFSPYSSGAHDKCVKLLKDSESHLLNTITELFKEVKNPEEQINNAHTKAIEAIRKACGSDTILSYLENNGPEALKSLFDKVGVEAARKYASENLNIIILSHLNKYNPGALNSFNKCDIGAIMRSTFKNIEDNY